LFGNERKDSRAFLEQSRPPYEGWKPAGNTGVGWITTGKISVRIINFSGETKARVKEGIN